MAGLGDDAEEKILKELKSMPKYKETLYRDWETGNTSVVPKKNRYNNTMADYSQDPDIKNGQGTVVNFMEYPHTNRLRCMLSDFIGSDKPLVAELNDYFEPERCGIGFHGE